MMRFQGAFQLLAFIQVVILAFQPATQLRVHLVLDFRLWAQLLLVVSRISPFIPQAAELSLLPNGTGSTQTLDHRCEWARRRVLLANHAGAHSWRLM